MSVPINIPKLGVSMSEGTLIEWLVPDGATVTEGQEIYRLETDKVENDVESPASGVIRITGIEGEIYSVGDPIGEIQT
jgi:pyruvate/2-oxoglutarate dehydrogenase complex dihydrolipoamide acyltransferase (E2) component